MIDVGLDEQRIRNYARNIEDLAQAIATGRSDNPARDAAEIAKRSARLTELMAPTEEPAP